MRRLAFDIGAHRGTKTQELLDFGYDHVVAVEPLLDSPYSEADERVTWVKSLVSDSNQPRDIYPLGTISTCSEEFMAKSRFKDASWGEPVTVRSTTLDDLMDVFGIPEYIKIDVEHHELAVLRGLPTHAVVPLLSFEWHSEFRDETLACLQLLESMGYHRFEIQMEDSLVPLHGLLADVDSVSKAMEDFDDLCKQRSDAWGQIWAKI